MRALPLYQPWASLVAMGIKRIETRPNRPPSTLLNGARFAVHACATPKYLRLMEREPFRGYADALPTLDGQLPLKWLVGTAMLSGFTLMDEEWIEELAERDPVEVAFGDYRPGRWAWFLHEPRHLAVPIRRLPSWGGGQGIFVVPDAVVEAEDLLGTL